VAASPIKIHSVAEAYLFLMVTPCTACGKGPLEAVGHEAVSLDHGSGQKMRAACKVCGQPHEFLFDLGYFDVADAADTAGLPRINGSDEPSLAIDAAQWVMLFEGIVQAADKQSDPRESRSLGYEAAQCLEEALKFYPPGDGEWPDESAFFYDWTLARFRKHRHIFARTRLIELRRKLPTLTQMEQHLLGQTALTPAKRPWWKFWG
jgi:hypothetical protein